MKIVAKCLVKNLPYACKNCHVDNELKGAYESKLLLPICLKEYSFANNDELYLLKSEIIGGNAMDFFEGKAKIFSETGIDISRYIINGLKKIKSLILSTDIYDVILPDYGILCGKKFIEDGTFSGGILHNAGILPEFLKKIIKEYTYEKS